VLPRVWRDEVVAVVDRSAKAGIRCGDFLFEQTGHQRDYPRIEAGLRWPLRCVNESILATLGRIGAVGPLAALVPQTGDPELRLRYDRDYRRAVCESLSSTDRHGPFGATIVDLHSSITTMTIGAQS
jgi:hypothetical protein